MSVPISLYIHIPFCRRKCNYCSFISFQDRIEDIPAYVGGVKKELAFHAQGQRLRSIYLGGGTPSLLSAEQVGDIFSAVRALFEVEETAEITIEANPGTVNAKYLSTLREMGINRLSLGVQSLRDSELKLLGRIHTVAEARDALRSGRDSGFTNINLDLIYGLPGQTVQEWRNTLGKVTDLGPEHLSLYALSVESGTPLEKAIAGHHLPEVDPDVCAEQYETAEEFLATCGYRHYEISNWARPGRECRHNMTYWQNLPYLGVGVAAHSYLDGHRLANTESMDNYLDAYLNDTQLVPEMDEEIGPELKVAERIILGLRLCQGICVDNIKNDTGIDLFNVYKPQLEEMVGNGLLDRNDRLVRLTRRGRLLSNEVFWRFLPG
ncbi:MAG: radical SAM family heme chaperone HemW [Dehalococcoidia bacterium]|nr:radical SAM family heme chaperone HemW [Dehalococcoidia bacterium]